MLLRSSGPVLNSQPRSTRRHARPGRRGERRYPAVRRIDDERRPVGERHVDHPDGAAGRPRDIRLDVLQRRAERTLGRRECAATVLEDPLGPAPRAPRPPPGSDASGRPAPAAVRAAWPRCSARPPADRDGPPGCAAAPKTPRSARTPAAPPRPPTASTSNEIAKRRDCMMVTSRRASGHRIGTLVHPTRAAGHPLGASSRTWRFSATRHGRVGARSDIPTARAIVPRTAARDNVPLSKQDTSLQRGPV